MMELYEMGWNGQRVAESQNWVPWTSRETTVEVKKTGPRAKGGRISAARKAAGRAAAS